MKYRKFILFLTFLSYLKYKNYLKYEFYIFIISLIWSVLPLKFIVNFILSFNFAYLVGPFLEFDWWTEIHYVRIMVQEIN